jgi:methionyl aminopeptidase
MDHGAYPATLFYRGYTKSICTSINHVVCHGIPNDKPLRDGDIMNVDFTVILDGWHGDSSRMFFVGEVPRRAARLCDITYEAMMRGIEAIRRAAPRTTSAPRSSVLPRASAARWCAISAATASAASSTTPRRSSTMSSRPTTCR